LKLEILSRIWIFRRWV